MIYLFFGLQSVCNVNLCLCGGFRGNGASVIRIVPYAALHFMTYERYKSWILGNCPMLGSGPFIDLLAGSAAGGTSVLCTYPLDLARTKLAYQVEISFKHLSTFEIDLFQCMCISFIVVQSLIFPLTFYLPLSYIQ